MFYNKLDIIQDPITLKKYYQTKPFAFIPLSETDIYIITNIGDSLTGLAYIYYKDSRLWKIISIANNNINAGSMFPLPGTQLRIPQNISQILNSFK